MPPFDPPDKTVTNVIGIIAIIIGLCYRIPQIYRTWKTESAKDISIWMIWIQNLSYVLYIAYGIMIWDWVYIASSIISVLQNFIILGMRYHYHKIDKQTTNSAV